MNHRQVVYSILSRLLAAQGRESIEISDQSQIHNEGLAFDSLTLAELSACLEDALGRDPYTAGSYPTTVGDLVAFYL